MFKKLGATWTIVVAAVSALSLIGLVYELVFVSTKRKIARQVDRTMLGRAKQLKKKLLDK
jgi:hypothetical protein